MLLKKDLKTDTYHLTPKGLMLISLGGINPENLKTADHLHNDLYGWMKRNNVMIGVNPDSGNLSFFVIKHKKSAINQVKAYMYNLFKF